uniref:vitamin-K-epoxide reductase (warfarin-sensitive) n=1 Tax=Globisporangium ultimum (strain ATCC 200006 / CBS 805.95 / DAOM BR144) TaxID=431595 RepID=K3WU77_GLOUD
MKKHKTVMPRNGRNFVIAGAIGALISAYGAYAEYQKAVSLESYTAMCDLQHFLYPKVMSSEYGRLLSYHKLVERGAVLDLPNSFLGVLAYSLFALYPKIRKVPFHPQFYMFASSCMMVMTVYLAYILAFILKDLCLLLYDDRKAASMSKKPK